MMDIDRCIDDRPSDGIFRVRRGVFSDPGLFELEMKHIFGGTWVCVGLEAQIPNPHDHAATWIGRTPLLLMRDGEGGVGVFFNVCPHKGALLTPLEQGNRKVHVCQFHGWSFDSAGRNVHVKDEKSGGYSDAFKADSHDLQPVPRVGIYRGLIFASLAEDVMPLEQHLGDMRTFIDLVIDQSPEGIEIVPGRVAYTYRANWKAQMDNTCDGYHLSSAHAAFMDVVRKRSQGAGHGEARQYDWDKRFKQQTGVVALPNGHALTWMDQAEPEKRPIYPVLDQIRERLGDVRADWMMRGRAITLFPNTQIADHTSLNLRIFRPLGPGLTEMRVYCLAPKGESDERRAWRLRQFEDFFNPSGLASPDDTAMYEMTHRGCSIQPEEYLQCYARGMTTLTRGAAGTVATLGIEPEHSQQGGFDASFETAMHAHYREWQRLMKQGMNQSAMDKSGLPQ